MDDSQGNTPGEKGKKVRRQKVNSLCMMCEFGVVTEVEGNEGMRLRRIYCRLLNCMTWSETKRSEIRACTHFQIRTKSLHTPGTELSS